MMEKSAWLFTALSLAGNIAIIKKSVLGYWLWVIANIGWIVYDVYIGAHAQATLFAAYLILAFYGIWEWSKKPAKKEEPVHD